MDGAACSFYWLWAVDGRVKSNSSSSPKSRASTFYLGAPPTFRCPKFLLPLQPQHPDEGPKIQIGRKWHVEPTRHWVKSFFLTSFIERSGRKGDESSWRIRAVPAWRGRGRTRVAYRWIHPCLSEQRLATGKGGAVSLPCGCKKGRLDTRDDHGWGCSRSSRRGHSHRRGWGQGLAVEVKVEGGSAVVEIDVGGRWVRLRLYGAGR